LEFVIFFFLKSVQIGFIRSIRFINRYGLPERSSPTDDRATRDCRSNQAVTKWEND